jgi:hypothetical protein
MKGANILAVIIEKVTIILKVNMRKISNILTVKRGKVENIQEINVGKMLVMKDEGCSKYRKGVNILTVEYDKDIPYSDSKRWKGGKYPGYKDRKDDRYEG